MGYTSWQDESFAEALALHHEVGVLDMHVDSVIQHTLFGYDVQKKHRAGVPGQPLFWHADVPRMNEGGYGGACMGIHYWPKESDRAWEGAKRQIAYVDEVCARDARCTRIRNAGERNAARAAGLLALSPGVEGAHMLGGRLERVAELRQLGVSYLTLTHFSKNSAATPSLGRGKDESSGLTDFGVELVARLNRYGIAIDVAHVNTPGVLDACRHTRAPVLCTHTGVKGVCDSPRNISDEEIDAISETGGAIGIILGPVFLAKRLRADSEAAADHIEYVAQRVGWEHVCIGSDYDGWMPSVCSDHRDCRDLVKVTAALLRRGATRDELAGMLRFNAERVMVDAWQGRDPDTDTEGDAP